MKEKLKFIPNVLSVIRIILVFVFIFFALNDKLDFAIIAFLIAGATDVLDGFLARRNGWITDIGKILDPFADKLMQCTVLIILYHLEILPVWFVLIFILKEIVTLFMVLLVIKRRNVVVVSKWYGKAAVCLFYATVVLAVMFEKFLSNHPLVLLIMLIPASALAVGAFIAYVRYYYLSLKHPRDSEEANETI